MKECPECGYLDPAHWRPRIFDFEIDFCTLGDLETIDPELAKKLIKPGLTIREGRYAYKITSSKYVWRMWLPLFEVRGWSPKFYYDSAGTRKTADYKKRASYRGKWINVKRLVREKNRDIQRLLTDWDGGSLS